ncbi:MAG: hypothetical protein L0Y72_14200 [Gemmataceae bacterium]|nr:hypothetical protein [Gemmataceae bacterium]
MTVQRIVALGVLAVVFVSGCHHCCGTTSYRPAYQVQPVVSATPAPCCNGQPQLQPPHLPPPPPPRY